MLYFSVKTVTKNTFDLLCTRHYSNKQFLYTNFLNAHQIYCELSIIVMLISQITQLKQKLSKLPKAT